MSSPTGQNHPPLNIPNPHTVSDIADLHEHSNVNSTNRAQFSAHPGGIEVDPNVLISTKTDDHLTKAKDALTGLQTASTQAKFDRLEGLEEKVAEAKDGAHKDFLIKQRDALKKELTKDGEKILRDHGKAATLVAKAQEAIAADVERVSAELTKKHEANVKRISSIKPTDEAHAQRISQELEEMSKAHEINLKAVSETGSRMSELVGEKAADAAKLAGDVEKHTGLKATDFGSKTLASVVSKNGKAPEGMWEKAKANFTGEGVKTSTKVFRGAGTVVGLGAMIDGLKKIVAPKRNEQGEREGTMFGAVGEAGLGAALAYASAVGFAKGKALGK